LSYSKEEVFDNGHLRADITMGRQFLDSLLSIMREGYVDNRQMKAEVPKIRTYQSYRFLDIILTLSKMSSNHSQTQWSGIAKESLNMSAIISKTQYPPWNNTWIFVDEESELRLFFSFLFYG
jgi:hypothetical protein